MPPFTACVVQTPSYPYDKAGNLQRALDTMETAAAQGASLILFPEMFLTGYLIRNKLEELSESLEDGPALAALSAKAKALSMGVLMGLPLKNHTGKPYNAIVMIDRDGTIAGVQAKTHFFGGEEKMFSPGEMTEQCHDGSTVDDCGYALYPGVLCSNFIASFQLRFLRSCIVITLLRCSTSLQDHFHVV